MIPESNFSDSLSEAQLSRGPLFIYPRARAREGSRARNIKEMQHQGRVKLAVITDYDCQKMVHVL